MALFKKYPCRSSFIKTLYNLFNVEECFPPAIFVCGHAGTGKTAIIKDFLRLAAKEKQFHGVYVNCVECYDIRILLENTLEELISIKNQNLRCDSIKDFVELLRDGNVDRREEYVLALDNAERLRDMDRNILPSFLRLQEITGLNICVVLISQISFEKYYSNSGLSEVITLHCSQYSKPETLKILSTQFEMAKQMLKTHIKKEISGIRIDKRNLEFLRQIDIINTLTHDFFNNYLNVFLSVFYKACRDVPELKITSCKCFLIYMGPVFNGSLHITDVSKLWRNLATPLRVTLSRVHMRHGNVEKNIAASLSDVSCSDQSIAKMAESLELPFYGKYLLIAAFLASHNSAKEDKRLFLKYGKQRKRLQIINSKAKVTEKMYPSLGPKSFNMDRLLAIFYAIIDEKVGLTCNLLSQISTLVHLKLLGFSSGENNIMEGSARLQCTVSLDFVLYMGKVVGFNVYQYLCDFN